MENNKIGKNVSSGAEKVEKIDRTTEQVDSKTPAKKTTKKTTSVKKTTPKVNTSAKKTKSASLKKAQKQERAAADKRVEKAKAKAEKKEKKLQKKVELKQKKLEKRAQLANKRADRKAKRLERRAALKEKKVERRAERIARRELLRNETKTEKNKRLEREKRERIALKRQKRDAREKARENKLKAREAAHARKAEDRKHRREQKTERKQNRRGFGGWLAAVISLGVACLALATIVTAGAFRLNDMQLDAESGARATLYEMVSVSEDMDNNLAKLRVSSGVDEQRKLLTEILVDTALLETAIERIPVDSATSTDISSFVNRANGLAKNMLSRLAAGKTLSEEEQSAITHLYEINAALTTELNKLATTMTEKELRAFLGGKQGTMSENFAKMGEGTREDPEELTDAPFAKEGNVGENKLAALEEITKEQAASLAKRYFEAYHIAEISYTGETVAPDVTCYNFRLTDENGLEFFAEITKNGGKLAFFDTYEDCKGKNFDLATCDAIAKEYLNGLGIENVEAVWLSDGGMVANLTYVTMEGGVRVYPEIIRVRVCESKGRVIGIDARGYLLNNDERNLSAGISKAEAESLLSGGLEVTASGLAVIPVDGREVLCYEFACNYGNEQYVIYLDADTGAEVQVFRVRQSARGSYLD